MLMRWMELLWSQRSVRGFIWQEILDVDGICGGYNLQFAWSSGMIAGKMCSGKCREEEYREKA